MAELIKPGDLKERMKKIPEWELEKKHIERTFEFDDFAEAIDFVNAVAEVAEEEAAQGGDTRHDSQVEGRTGGPPGWEASRRLPRPVGVRPAVVFATNASA